MVDPPALEEPEIIVLLVHGVPVKASTLDQRGVIEAEAAVPSAAEDSVIWSMLRLSAAVLHMGVYVSNDGTVNTSMEFAEWGLLCKNHFAIWIPASAVDLIA